MLAAPFDATRSRAGFADATNNASTFANDSKTFATSSAPGARCGHTMTALRWNQKTKIVTFGGHHAPFLSFATNSRRSRSDLSNDPWTWQQLFR